MILFISDPKILQYTLDNYSTRRIYVYNLSSAIYGFKELNGLISNMSQIFNKPIEDIDTVQFDVTYASTILNTPYRFADLFRIISGTFEGDIVVVLVFHDYYRDAILESLIKLIQQRYTINSWIINEIDDLQCVYEDSPSVSGILNYNEDVSRIRSLYASGMIDELVLKPDYREY